VNDESTQQQVDDANAAVANANAKIAEAADVSDDMKATHTASVTAIETSLTNAEMSWQTAQDASQELADQRMYISNAIAAANTAVGVVTDAATDEEVAAADMAIAAANAAIAEAGDVLASEAAAKRAEVAALQTSLDEAKASRMVEMTPDEPDPAIAQREAISSAIAAAMTAVDAVADDSTAEVVEAAENAIAAANAAIAEAGDVLASEAAAKRAEVAALQTSLDEAKASRMVEMTPDEPDPAIAQREAIKMEADASERQSSAIAAAMTAVDAVADDSTAEPLWKPRLGAPSNWRRSIWPSKRQEPPSAW
jgi:hypothetical protein